MWAVLIGFAAAHEMAWCPKDNTEGVLHRDISFNNILIYETYFPEELQPQNVHSGKLVRLGMLSDWDMSKFKAQITAGVGPRQHDVTVGSNTSIARQG